MEELWCDGGDALMGLGGRRGLLRRGREGKGSSLLCFGWWWTFIWGGMGAWSLASEEEETEIRKMPYWIVCCLLSGWSLAREDRGSCHTLQGTLTAVRACSRNGGLLAMIRRVAMRCSHYRHHDDRVCP